MNVQKPDERLMLKKSLFFSKLLGTYSYGSLEILQRDAEDVGIPIAHPVHRIIVAEIELWEESFSRTDKHFDPETRSEVIFVLSNLGYDLFSMDGQCHVASSDFQGRIVFWLDADSDKIPTSEFRSCAIQATNLLESEYRLFVTFSISPWFSDLLYTYPIYQDALNVLFYFRYIASAESVFSIEDW